MWIIAPDGFVPVSKEKAILGTLTATFDDGVKPFTFSGSVNLSSDASLQDFVAQAQKALAVSKAVTPLPVKDNQPVLEWVAGRLNVAK